MMVFLNGRFIAEERDTIRLLRASYDRLRGSDDRATRNAKAKSKAKAS